MENEAPVVGMQEQVTQQVDSSSPPPASDTQAPVEKMIPQSKMSEAIKLAKRDADNAGYERARRELLATQAQTQPQQESQAPSSMGGIIQLTPEQQQQQFDQKVYDAANRLRERDRFKEIELQAQEIENSYSNVVEDLKSSDPDFALKYEKFNIGKTPELVLWTHGMENRGEVIKDLVNNPSKLANILTLSRNNMQEGAQEQLHQLSASIKANLDAQKKTPAKEPLDHLKPSSINADSGEMSVSDFANQKWLRG